MKAKNINKKIDFTKKDGITIIGGIPSITTEALLEEVILTLPKGLYRRVNTKRNIIDTVWNLHGLLIKWSLMSPHFWLNMQIKHPKKFIVAFNQDMVSIEIF